MLVRQASPGIIHVHAAQAGQGRVVELLFHAGQLVSLPLHREQDGWGRVHVGGAIVPGHQVDDARHSWGAKSTKGFTLGSGQPDTLQHRHTTLASADLSSGLTFIEHLLYARSFLCFHELPVWWQGQSDNMAHPGCAKGSDRVRTEGVRLGRLGLWHSGNGLQEVAFESILK